MSAALHNLVDDMRRRYQVLEQSCPSCIPASHSPHRTRRVDGSLLVNQYAPPASQHQHSQYHHVSAVAPHMSTCFSTSCAAAAPQCCGGGGCCCGVPAYTTSCCGPVLVTSPPRRHVTVVSPARQQFNASTASVMYDNNRNTSYTATGYQQQQQQPSRAQDAHSTNNSIHGHLEALGSTNNNTSRDIADGVLNNMGMNPHTAGYDPSNYAAQNGDLNGGGHGGASFAEDEEAENRRQQQRNSRTTQRRAANGGDVEVDEKTDELREKFNLIQESGDTISADELKTILAILRRKGPSSVPDQQRLFDAASKAAGSITDHTRASHVLNISHDGGGGTDDNNQTSTNAHVTSATHSKYYNVVHTAEQNSQINMPKAADVMRRIGEHLDGSTTTATKARQSTNNRGGAPSGAPSGAKSRRPIGVQKGRAAGQSRQSKIDEAGNLSTLPFQQTGILHNSSTIRAPSAGNNHNHNSSIISPRRAVSASAGGIRSSSIGGVGRAPIPSDVQGLGIRTSIPSRPVDHPDAFVTGGSGGGGVVRAPITHQHIAGAGVVFTTGVEGRTATTNSGSNVQAASLAPPFVSSDISKPSRRRVLYCEEDVRRDNQTYGADHGGTARPSSAGRGASWRAPHPVVQAGTCIPIATPTSQRAVSIGNKGKRTYDGTIGAAPASATIRAASARKEAPFDHTTRGQGTRKPRDFITTLYDVKGIRTDPKYHGPESLTTTANTGTNKKGGGRSGVLFTEVRH